MNEIVHFNRKFFLPLHEHPLHFRINLVVVFKPCRHAPDSRSLLIFPGYFLLPLNSLLALNLL